MKFTATLRFTPTLVICACLLLGGCGNPHQAKYDKILSLDEESRLQTSDEGKVPILTEILVIVRQIAAEDPEAIVPASVNHGQEVSIKKYEIDLEMVRYLYNDRKIMDDSSPEIREILEAETRVNSLNEHIERIDNFNRDGF